MAIEVNLRDIQSGFLSASAIDMNNTLIEQAFVKALNREGGDNNAMEADLDLGLNNIINVDNLSVNNIDIDGTNYETVLQSIADAAEVFADASANSAADSLSSANAAQAALAATQVLSDQFRGTYYGEATTDPTEDPLGAPITPGDLYYNTTDNML